jgi:predicted dehydrogenase/acetyltransferase-like isoleucine patch superfamily enzyme
MDTIDYFIHESSYADSPISIGNGTKIWHFSHIMKDCKIGQDCNIGQNVVISSEVSIGNRVKIQNNVSVYTGVIIEDDVFLGPSCVFTNVINPRSFIERKKEYKETIVGKGASIGANATIVCGNSIGKYAFVGAGSVVTKDVPDYALVVGNPSRITGYICECGEKLIFNNDNMASCSCCDKIYKKDNTTVTECEKIKKLKFAIIGCGRICHKHLEAIKNNREEAELVALCDIVPGLAFKKSEEYKTMTTASSIPKAYVDYKQMLKEMDIDIVTVATESGYHSSIALYCMEHGKHVIVEKPMALSLKDADSMIAASKSNNVKLCVCHQNRFNPAIQKLREAIEKNRFGKLISGTARILWNRDMGYYKQAPWRGTWKLDGGTLMNQCIHNIDLLQWILGGEIESVYALCDTFLRKIEAEDFGSIIIRFKNKSIGIVEGSACVFPENLKETLDIFGENGTACIGGIAANSIESWKFLDSSDNEEDIMKEIRECVNSIYGYGHTPLFKDMINAVIKDIEPAINGEEGKKSISIVLAAYKSSLTENPIKFPLEDFSTLNMTHN